jgi:hypothetical protein
VHTAHEVRVAGLKGALRKKKNFTSRLEETGTALYIAGTGTLWRVDQEHQESFEMWCWRRLEKVSWIDRVRDEQ